MSLYKHRFAPLTGVLSYNVVNGGLEVVIDDSVMPEAGPIVGVEAKPAEAKPATGAGHGSEFAQLVTSGFDFVNHGDGLLYDKSGKLLSKPENTDPVPHRLARGLADLQQFQIDHPYWKNQSYVDGQGDDNKQGYPGDPTLPGVYWASNADGSWTLRSDAGPAPAPIPVATIPSSPGPSGTDLGWPASGFAAATIGETGGAPVTFAATVPATLNFPVNPQHLGYGADVERPGTQPIKRTLVVAKNGVEVYLDTDAIGGSSCNFSVNNPNSGTLGAQFDATNGDVLTWTYTPGDNILFHLMTPDRP